MQIKRATRLERLAQPLIRFMGVFATRAKRRGEALWRSKALKRAETLRDAKAHISLAWRAHAYGYGVQNEPCACKTPVRKTTAELLGGGRLTIGNKHFCTIKFCRANGYGKGVCEI